MDLKDGLKFTDKLSPDIQFPVCFVYEATMKQKNILPAIIDRIDTIHHTSEQSCLQYF